MYFLLVTLFQTFSTLWFTLSGPTSNTGCLSIPVVCEYGTGESNRYNRVIALPRYYERMFLLSRPLLLLFAAVTTRLPMQVSNS